MSFNQNEEEKDLPIPTVLFVGKDELNYTVYQYMYSMRLRKQRCVFIEEKETRMNCITIVSQ